MFRKLSKIQKTNLILLLITIIGGIGAVWLISPDSSGIGLALSALKAKFEDKSIDPQQTNTLLQVQTERDCRYNLLLASISSPAEKKAAFQAAVACSPVYIDLAAAAYPIDPEMASQAVQAYPESASAWIWFAKNQKKPVDILAAYQRASILDAGNGSTWCSIGTYAKSLSKYDQARDAFYRCCLENDPGSVGCYYAGQMAEKLGNIEQAIGYYQLSKWPEALKRAQELELQVRP